MAMVSGHGIKTPKLILITLKLTGGGEARVSLFFTVIKY